MSLWYCSSDLGGLSTVPDFADVLCLMSSQGFAMGLMLFMNVYDVCVVGVPPSRVGHWCCAWFVLVVIVLESATSGRFPSGIVVCLSSISFPPMGLVCPIVVIDGLKHLVHEVPPLVCVGLSHGSQRTCIVGELSQTRMHVVCSHRLGAS